MGKSLVYNASYSMLGILCIMAAYYYMETKSPSHPERYSPAPSLDAYQAPPDFQGIIPTYQLPKDLMYMHVNS
jgi:hypothetical protein